MKDKDNSVIFLKDWLFLITPMSVENQIVFWELFTNYEYGKEQECENPFVAPTWNFVKKQLDNMREGYNENVVNRNRINGSKGGRPPKASRTQSDKSKPIETEEHPKNPVGYFETQKTPNVNVNENINENVNDILLKKESKEENITKENSEELFDIPPELEKRKNVPPKKEKELEQRRKIFFFKKAMIEYGFEDESLIDHFIAVRKKKNLVNTEVAFKNFIREIEKTQKDKNEVFRIVTQKQWGGFEAKWLNNLDHEKTNSFKTKSNGTGLRRSIER